MQPEDFRLLRGLGLLTMALVIGPRLVPGLQRYGRVIGIGAAILYVAVGLGLLLYRTLV